MATNRIINGVTITINDNVRNVSDYTLSVLADLLRSSNNTRATITSGQRTPREQAVAMYNNILSQGEQSQRALYAAPGDRVIDAWLRGTLRGETREQIIQRMVDQINIESPQRVSLHCSDFTEWNVIDVAPSSIENGVAFTMVLNIARGNEDVTLDYIEPGNDPAHHIAIYQPESSREAVERLQNPNLLPQNITPDSNTQNAVRKYTYLGADLTLLSSLILSPTFIGFNINIDTLLNFTHLGVSNRRRIWNALPINRKRDSYGGVFDNNTEYTLTNPTTLYIPINEVNVGVKVSDETSPQSGDVTDIPTYTSNVLIAQSEADELFPSILKRVSLEPSYTLTDKKTNSVTREQRPQHSCKIWSRTLDLMTGNGFIDVSADIISCRTNSRMEGSDFTITLKPITTSLQGLDDETNQRIWEKSYDGEVSLGNTNRLREIGGTDGEAFDHRRNLMFYDMILQQNDLVRIKFERLEFEDEDIERGNISGVGEWWDLVGLIDQVTDARSGSSSGANITISGRDLTKCLIDDNTYFNPYSVGSSVNYFGGDINNIRLPNGQIQAEVAVRARNIRESLEFIINYIVAIGYVPDKVFDGIANPTNIVEEGRDTRGVWKMIKLFVDRGIEDMILADDSISNPDGSILDLFNKICQQPFVEFFTETIGDKFYLQARKPPFEREALVRLVSELPRSEVASQTSNIEQNKNIYTQAEQDSENIDTSGFIGLLPEVTVEDSQFPLIVNIKEADVLEDSLTWSNESYCWYQVENRIDFQGDSVSNQLVPAIYFDDVAQVFGNKRLSVQTNYSDYKFIQKKGQEDDELSFAEQTLTLLTYLVETNIHLPFTRTGTITLNGGDRRIKKGNYIYYRPTREVFYVTGVTHDISIKDRINRTTHLEVERGMILDYIEGETEEIMNEDTGRIEQIDVSYFNIVDTDNAREVIRQIRTGENRNNTNNIRIEVNKPVFDFFLQRRQFKQYD